MTSRLREVPFNDFSGGLASAKPTTQLQKNEATVLKNVYITPGKSLAKRQGNTAFNSTAMNAGATVTGLAYYKQADGDDWLVCTAGNAIFKSDSLDGTMDDITGGLTVTAGNSNTWTPFVFNDNVIFVGGAPDAPFTWTGSGNAAALGGSPPSGNFGFQLNNRVFIHQGATDQSGIAWSVLNDAADWSGEGSGSQSVYTDDGDTLVGAARLNTDIVLLFKQNSIHQMVVRTAPFPVFPLFQGVGAVGKHAIVEADGLVYFITPRGKMKITDGARIYGEETFPRIHNIDDIWEALNSSRLSDIFGFRYTGKDFDHLIWLCSSTSSSSNDLALVWDLRNKCWLYHPRGFNYAVAAVTQAKALYGGGYDGVIYSGDVADTYADNSETSTTAIDGYWQSGWYTPGGREEAIRPFRGTFDLKAQSAGNLTVGYGFNFLSGSRTANLTMIASGASVWNAFTWGSGTWGEKTDLQKEIFFRGRGSLFQVYFQNDTVNQAFIVHGFTVSGKPAGTKVFSAK